MSPTQPAAAADQTTDDDHRQDHHARRRLRPEVEGEQEVDQAWGVVLRIVVLRQVATVGAVQVAALRELF